MIIPRLLLSVQLLECPARNSDKMSESTGDHVSSLIGEFQRVAVIFHRLPEEAESYLRKRGSVPGHGEQKIKERIAAIGRIEAALEQGVTEISTFQFFGLIDPLAPSSCKKVKVQIDVVGFRNEVYMSKHNLFNGTLPCNFKESDDGWRNITYFPIPAIFASDATEGYLVATVYSEQAASVTGYATRKRNRVVKRAPDLVELKVSYGCRLLFKRSSSFDKLNIVFENSSIRLKCAGCDTDATWFTKRQLLACMYSSMEVLYRKSPVPYITFELSDQHVEEDWNKIQEQKSKIAKKKSLSGATTKLSYEVAVPHCGEDSASNSSSSDSIVDAFVLLSQMTDFRCPFCLEDFDGSYQLLHHLNSRYPFTFKLKGNGVSIDVSHLEGLENVYTSVSPVKIVSTKDAQSGTGALPDNLVPLVPPPITPCPLYSLDGRKDYHFVRNPSNWIDEFIERCFTDYVDIAADDRYFLRLINDYFQQKSELTTSEQQKVAVLKDLTEHISMDGSVSHNDFCTRMAAMVKTLFDRNYIAQVSLNELLHHIFRVTP